MVVVKAQVEVLIDHIMEAENKIEGILRPCSLILIVIIINSGRRAKPRSQAIGQNQAGSPRFSSCHACRSRRLESIAACPTERVIAAHVINSTFEVRAGHTPVVFKGTK